MATPSPHSSIPVPATVAPIHAIVPCAGSGSRAGATLPKQYVQLDGRPVVAHTLAALGAVSRLARLLVVVAKDDDAFEQHVGAVTASHVAVARVGGATRAASVAAGIVELSRLGARPDDWVLVHDAARCLVRVEWIDALIDACGADPVGGLLAMPVADTLKRESHGRSVATIPREGVWQAQTPQMFRLGILARGLADAGAGATDESSAVEALGLSPRLVPGSAENWKLTHAADFAIAEAILKRRRGA